MQAQADALSFAPPPEPAAFRAFVLAVIAHLLLMAALTWGINWNKDDVPVAAEAELWSSIPQQAAPPPAPPPPPPAPSPPVQQPPVAQPAPQPPVAKQPDIAIEREKQRREEAQRRQHEEEQRKLEAQKKREQLEAQKKREQQEAQAKREQQEKLAREQQEKASKEKARKEALAKRDEQSREAARKDQLARMMAAAAGTGSPSSTGTAAHSKGPSPGYANRIAARIKPNIVFTDVISGNPAAEVLIRAAPDGTIVSVKLAKSSGSKSWDDAVVRAVEKTEVLPRDTDGTVVPEFLITFRPRD